MQSKGATHLLLLFYNLQLPALYFSTQMRNSKAAASQIWLPELQRLTGTAGCSARAAVLPLQPQREPDAGSVLGWGSQRARAAAVGVTEHWVICFVPWLLCGGDVSRLYLLQAEIKERFCISICVCEISSVREILLGLPYHYTSFLEWERDRVAEQHSLKLQNTKFSGELQGSVWSKAEGMHAVCETSNTPS